MDGISAITQRISEIHSLIAGLDQTVASTRTATTSSTASSTLASSVDASFATVLAQASEGTDALAAASQALNADGVPVALAGYGNGLIPESQLAPITGSDERLWGPAAAQLDKLIADAKAAGHTITVNDGYRDYDTQVRLAAEKGLHSQGGLAAAPGTSEHGWGLAVDLSLDSSAQSWMREHASEYGFYESVSREPWHWEFHPDA